MSALFTGIVFLLVGGGIFVYNQESTGSAIVFPTLSPENTVLVLLSLGIFFLLKGGWDLLRAAKDQRER